LLSSHFCNTNGREQEIQHLLQFATRAFQMMTTEVLRG
jgi:hypothetical protein